MLQNLSSPVQTALFLGALGLLPALLVCVTSFTRIVIVLSFVRRAVTSQEIPPTFVVIGISLFLTLFVMGPTWMRSAPRPSLLIRTARSRGPRHSGSPRLRCKNS